MYVGRKGAIMSRTETLKLIISGDGRKLSNEIGKSERQIKSYGNSISSIFTGVNKHIYSSVKRMATNPLAIVGGTAGLLYAGKQIVDYDSKLTRLGIQAEISAKEMFALREQISKVSLASGQSRLGILSGLDKIVEQTGDLAFARDVMNELAVASTATGAGMEYLGALAVQLKEKFKVGKAEIGTALNLLTVQGKAGAFTLENMATLGERLFAAAGRFDMNGLKDLGNFGALMQVSRMGTGSSEQATTAIENLLSDILNKQKQIRKAGFNIFGSDGELKHIDEIIKGILIATKGNEIKLGQIFGQESIRGLSTLAKLYRDTHGFELFDKLAGADADHANQILKDFAKYSQSAKYQIDQLGNIFGEFADAGLSPIISDLNVNLRKLTENPQEMEKFLTKIRGMGKDLGDSATSILKLTESLSQLLPLLNIVSGTVGFSTTIFKAPFGNCFLDSQKI